MSQQRDEAEVGALFDRLESIGLADPLLALDDAAGFLAGDDSLLERAIATVAPDGVAAIRAHVLDSLRRADLALLTPPAGEPS